MENDPRGLALVDASREGFVRSFLAFVWCWPAQAFLATGLWREAAGAAPDSILGMIGFFLTSSGFDVLTWIVPPLILYPVSGMFGFRRDYMRLVAVSNWFNVVAVYIAFLPATVSYLAPVPDGVVTMMFFAASGLTIGLYFRVARVTLGGEALLAALVTLIAVTASLFISAMAWGALSP